LVNLVVDESRADLLNALRPAFRTSPLTTVIYVTSNCWRPVPFLRFRAFMTRADYEPVWIRHAA